MSTKWIVRSQPAERRRTKSNLEANGCSLLMWCGTMWIVDHNRGDDITNARQLRETWDSVQGEKLEEITSPAAARIPSSDMRCQSKIVRSTSSGMERIGWIAARCCWIDSAHVSFALFICSRIACTVSMHLATLVETERAVLRLASKDGRMFSSGGSFVETSRLTLSGTTGTSNRSNTQYGHSWAPFWHRLRGELFQ